MNTVPTRTTCSLPASDRGVESCRLSVRLVVTMFTVSLAGCRSEMIDQPRYEPMELCESFDDRTSARNLVAGTVPQPDRRQLVGVNESAVFLTGLDGGQPATALPFPLDRQVLRRGQERYRIFCTPCHGELGDGQGIIVKRGFTPPPSFASQRLRNEPLGHFLQVITQGHGVMYSYASRVSVRDRWAISAYIRALQLSQHATVSQLSSADKEKLSEVAP